MDVQQQEQYMRQLDKIAIPELERAIVEGQRRAEQEQRSIRLKRLQRGMIAFAATACLMLALLVGIRVSPVLASTLSQIPLVSELVELIAGNKDKGLQDIVDNEYYEVIDQTVTENGISLTIKGVIADESGMNVFYRVTSERGLVGLDTRGIRILQDGKDLEGGMSYSFFHREEDTAIDDHIQLGMEQKIDYSSKQFALEVTFTDEYETTITIPFELKQQIAATKSYSIGKEVAVNDQKIWIDELNITPLRAELKLHADESNSMRLLGIRSLELIDEHGEQWGAITNGVTARGSFDENGYSLYIQSNYFRDPEQLTLRIGEIEALPKGEDYIEVDFGEQKVLYQPSLVEGELLVSSDSIVYIGAEELNALELYKGSLFSTGIDANGKTIYSTFGTRHSGSEYRTQDRFELEGSANPVRFPIVSYPKFLPGSAQIDIPLTVQ